jgi:hypothetical protein
MAVKQLPFRAPSEVPISDKSGRLTRDWFIHLELSAQQLKTPANQVPPASAVQVGQNGQMAVGGGFLWVYDGSVNKWLKFIPAPF